MRRLVVELIPDVEEGGFTARVPDIPAYGEGETAEQAVADLREALTGYIETFGFQDAATRLSPPSTLLEVDWSLEDLAPVSPDVSGR